MSMERENTRRADADALPDDPAVHLRAEHERLATLTASLRATHADIVDAATDVATDDEHDPEGHTVAFEREQHSALLHHAESQLEDVERAIDRADRGDYGRCEGCGTTIARERLVALPATPWCIRCAP